MNVWEIEAERIEKKNKKVLEMVEYDPKKRIEAILGVIIPSILKLPENPEWQMRMLDKNELIANELNAQIGYEFADLKQVFMDARHSVR